jgi:hypothetical protein
MINFGAQSHGFGTGCLRFVPSSLMTTQDSLPGVANLSGWDSILPTEFLWEVSAFRLPLPLSFAWRELILILIQLRSSARRQPDTLVISNW